MSEPAPRTELRVRKRDGSIEPFNLGKLTQSIQTGLLCAGDSPDLVAVGSRGLAEAVLEFLGDARADGPVTTERVAEWVETILTQTGHGPAAMALRQFAQFRDRFRRRLLVASARGREGRIVHRRWDKARLIRHLCETHDLGSPMARMIAGRVEQLVFSTQLRVVTAGLIGELTNSELLAWGLLPEALLVKRTKGAKRTQPRVRDNLDLA